MRLLERNAEAQRTAIQESGVYHDFRFSDHSDASGIQFEHRAVEDAAKNWTPAHYDHGCGVAVADVDGDGLLDLYFANQVGGNALYRNLGKGRFEDVTEKAGVALKDRISVAAAFADIDNDSHADLFVTTVNMGNALFRNRGDGTFEDISASAGVGYKGHSSGAVFFDFDRDGLLDLFVVNVGRYTIDETGPGGFYRAYENAFRGHLEPDRTEPSLLYRNLGGGKFREVSREMHLTPNGWTGDATACDLNSDSYPDLYVLNMQGDDFYFENEGGKRFVDRTAKYFPKTPWGAMGVKFFDYNLDGSLDLFITDMHSDMSDSQTGAGRRDYSLEFDRRKSDVWCAADWGEEILQDYSNNILGNAFYRREADGTFTEISEVAGAETYWPWGISVADLNADGFEDVFVTAGMGYPFRYAPNNILLNDNGRMLYRSELVLGAEPRTERPIQKPYFTLDCSGDDQGHNLCQGQRGTVAVMGSVSSRSSAVLDLDGDGDLDIITNDFHDRPLVLLNDLAERHNIRFLKVSLEGTGSNRDGLGTIVRLTAGGKTQTRYHDGKSGYLAQSLTPLYFGLGAADTVTRIEVKWPSGKTQMITENIPVNGMMVITEPGE